MEVKETTLSANELRIGNWVNYNYDIGNNLSRYEIVDIDILDEILDGYTPYTYEPIPITNEILEKCGFNETVESYNASEKGMTYEKIDGVKFFGEHKYKIFPIKDEWILVEVLLQCQFGAAFKHLHQLQNLYFALTSEELEVDLT